MGCWECCSCATGVNKSNRTCNNRTPSLNGSFVYVSILCFLVHGEWRICDVCERCSSSHRNGENATQDVHQSLSLTLWTLLYLYIFFVLVHGDWSVWGAWEGCSSSCGAGVKMRHRTCTNPTPSLYGRYCLGDTVQYDICSGHICGNTTTTIGNYTNFYYVEYLIDSFTGLHSLPKQTESSFKQ